MNKAKSKIDNTLIKKSIDKAIIKYIKSRKQKIPTFVKKNFLFKGAFKINKKAMGKDLIKGPFNIFWSLPYTGFKISSAVMRKIGIKKIPSLLDKLPHGFETKVQQEIKWLIYTELLEIPYSQKDRSSKKDVLFEYILNQAEISVLFVKPLSEIKAKSKDPRFRNLLEDNLQEYASSRTAVADLSGSIISLAIGSSVFKKMTPGAMATGGAIATSIAQNAAISNFFLGSTLGSIYYSVFPVTASMGLLVASIGSIMAALSIVTSFIGIITDPIQVGLGIHQRRLRKFVDAIEMELKDKSDVKYQLKDRYVARILDLLDIIKTAASTVIK